jgi:hypothetical protein
MNNNRIYPRYPLPFGDTEIVVVSDGPLDMGTPEDSFRGLSKEKIQEQLLRNVLPIDKVVIEQNIPILTSGGERILFETGIGSLKMFGRTPGDLQTSLQEAGIDPGSIDAIVCSHSHLDHIGGICTDDGAPLFPNAQIYLSENDFSFWTDEKQLGQAWTCWSRSLAATFCQCVTGSSSSRMDRSFCPVYRLCLPQTHEGTCLLHRDIGEPDDVPHWRSRTSSCFAAGAATQRIHLRPRSSQAGEARVKVLGMLSKKRIALYGGHFHGQASDMSPKRRTVSVFSGGH